VSLARPARTAPGAPIRPSKSLVRQHGLTHREMCEEIFDRHADTIRVNRKAVAVANLDRIIAATLSVSNRRGFRAMSVRDLANETGMSMGGLYAYFESKETLLMMIVGQVRAVTERVLVLPTDLHHEPAERLRWLLRPPWRSSRARRCIAVTSSAE